MIAAALKIEAEKKGVKEMDEEWTEFIGAESVTPLSKMGALLAEMRNEFEISPEAQAQRVCQEEKVMKTRNEDLPQVQRIALVEESEKKLRRRCAELEATVANLRQQLFTVPQDESLESLESKLKASAQLLLQGDASQEDIIHELDEAIRRHPVYKEREAKAEEKWEREQYEQNQNAYKEQQRLVPSDIANSTKDFVQIQCENAFGTKGRALSNLANRLFQNKVLWLVHFSNDALERLHPVDLRDRYVINGLDIIELRATYHAVASLGDRFYTRDRTGLKLQWRNDIRTKLKSLLAATSLPKNIKRHPVYRNLGKHLLREDSLRHSLSPSSPLRRKSMPNDENSSTTKKVFVPSPPPLTAKPKSKECSPRSRYLLVPSDARLNAKLLQAAIDSRRSK